MKSFAVSAALAAAVLFSVPAHAQSTTAGKAGTKSSTSFAWGGIGFDDVGVSVDVPGFGSVSGSSGYFALNAGAATDVLRLAPTLPLDVFGDVNLGLGGDIFLPLTAGAAVRYDQLPVQLFGGLGFTVMPHSGGGSTPLGVSLLAMGLYPLPQIDPRVSAQAKLQYAFLSDGFWMFSLTVGAGYAF